MPFNYYFAPSESVQCLTNGSESMQDILRCVPSPLRRATSNGAYNQTKNSAGGYSNGHQCDDNESSGYNSSSANLIDNAFTSTVNANNVNEEPNDEANATYESSVNVANQQLRIIGGNRNLVKLSTSILNEAFAKAEAAKQLLKSNGLLNISIDGQLLNTITRTVDELPKSFPLNNHHEAIAMENSDKKLKEAISVRLERPRRTHFSYDCHVVDEIDGSKPRHVYAKENLMAFCQLSKPSALPRDWNEIARKFPAIIRY